MVFMLLLLLYWWRVTCAHNGNSQQEKKLFYFQLLSYLSMHPQAIYKLKKNLLNCFISLSQCLLNSSWHFCNSYFSGYFAGSYTCLQQKFPAKTLSVRGRQRSIFILHSIIYICTIFCIMPKTLRKKLPLPQLVSHFYSIPSNALFFSHNYLKDLKRHKKWTEFFLWEWAQ